MSMQLPINFPDTRGTFADFFSGCGGLSLGFINGGLKCLSALEINVDAAWTYWYNLCYKGWSHLWVDPEDKKLIRQIQRKWEDGKTNNVLWKNGVPDNWLEADAPMPCLNLFVTDILKLSPEQWMDMIGVRPGEISIFAGGPPCQGFSTANANRSMFDKRNQLALRMIEYAKVAKPDYVLIENVPGLISLGRKKGETEGPFVHWIRQAFNEAGYTMEWEIHNAADYGVPQNRRRVIFFAARNDLKPFMPRPSKKQIVNVYEAIGHLPPISAGETYSGAPYTITPKKDYGICPYCINLNKLSRVVCHNCNRPVKFIKGSCSFAPELGLVMLDHKPVPADCEIFKHLKQK